MAMTRFTLFGLAMAALGWVALVADVVLGPFVLQAGSMASVAVLRSDLFSLAETTIFSGFALALIGVLRSGFGALHRFFDAVLDRASVPRDEVPTLTPEPVAIVPAVELGVLRATEAKPVRGRNYVILANGAVEVETLLGTRVFASLDEARDYIR